jgi:hypothetical protein
MNREAADPSGRRECHDTAAAYAADRAAGGEHCVPGPKPRAALTRKTNAPTACFAIKRSRVQLGLVGHAQRTCELSERVAVGNGGRV